MVYIYFCDFFLAQKIPQICDSLVLLPYVCAFFTIGLRRLWVQRVFKPIFTVQKIVDIIYYSYQNRKEECKQTNEKRYSNFHCNNENKILIAFLSGRTWLSYLSYYISNKPLCIRYTIVWPYLDRKKSLFLSCFLNLNLYLCITREFRVKNKPNQIKWSERNINISICFTH